MELGIGDAFPFFILISYLGGVMVKRQAFSLVQALVVLAIIAILIALLVPAT